ncbi:MAG: hypothetical protein ABIH34_08515 [Nanoarchaeota archaeon]
MNHDRAKLEQLDEALQKYLQGYQERRKIFAEFPKVDIDPIFKLWDGYLEFLDTHKEEEREAIRKYEERTGEKKHPMIVAFSGDWSDIFYDATTAFYGELSQKMDHVESDQSIFLDAFLAAIEDGNMRRFFSHDVHYIIGDLKLLFSTVIDPSIKSSINHMRNRRDHVRQFLEQYNADPESLFGAQIEPYKMLDFIVTNELGKSPRLETFNPGKLARQTGYILANRYPQAEYVIVNQATATSRNEIGIDAEDFNLKGNSGVVFSIIYNLAKNAYKKLGTEPNASQKISIQVYEAGLSNYVIQVSDSGKPMDLNVMKDNIRQLILDEGIDSVVSHSKKAKKRFADWQESEYKVGDLRLGDLSDVAFMARMSGFDNDDEFSSGMGLYGLKYLLDSVGGKVLYGERFDDGSPVFTCVIPKKFPAGRLDKYLNNVLAGLESKRIYHQGMQRPNVRVSVQ